MSHQRTSHEHPTTHVQPSKKQLSTYSSLYGWAGPPPGSHPTHQAPHEQGVYQSHLRERTSPASNNVAMTSTACGLNSVTQQPKGSNPTTPADLYRTQNMPRYDERSKLALQTRMSTEAVGMWLSQLSNKSEAGSSFAKSPQRNNITMTRTYFDEAAKAVLEDAFNGNAYPSTAERAQLATRLGVDSEAICSIIDELGAAARSRLAHAADNNSTELEPAPWLVTATDEDSVAEHIRELRRHICMDSTEGRLLGRLLRNARQTRSTKICSEQNVYIPNLIHCTLRLPHCPLFLGLLSGPHFALYFLSITLSGNDREVRTSSTCLYINGLTLVAGHHCGVQLHDELFIIATSSTAQLQVAQEGIAQKHRGAALAMAKMSSLCKAHGSGNHSRIPFEIVDHVVKRRSPRPTPENFHTLPSVHEQGRLSEHIDTRRNCCDADTSDALAANGGGPRFTRSQTHVVSSTRHADAAYTSKKSS
ncbi:hypothetical protein L227DRAFT_565163 [Lentinus tigrinus ALCF2SS1-6]|uniref:Homeobox domain-containing protein n=1 Tax=Lentinus tigrinus ALCF2SS1-6 TaxID=1328759 RepID=A0A5C2S278_9APHY|nr:hypothetical protein L227DRAFT_565163 [Lentinus tigrinus ALCF2SS1-6]